MKTFYKRRSRSFTERMTEVDRMIKAELLFMALYVVLMLVIMRQLMLLCPQGCYSG